MSPSDYATASDLNLGVVSYHCGGLRNAGILSVKELVQKRGAMENRYELGSKGALALAVIDLLDSRGR